jgi:predicted HicB family RNase H-like nuclease
MHLSVVSSTPVPPTEFVPDTVELARQPWRPGQLCQVVDLRLPATLRARLDRAAAKQGIPVAVVVQAAVEAERVIRLVTASSRKTRTEIAAVLDDAAAATPERGVDPTAVRRLRAYALAIFVGTYAPTEPTPARFALRVPQSLAAAWSLAAATETARLEQWIVRTLERAELTRARWEAAAAFAGSALESWAAVAVLDAR